MAQTEIKFHELKKMYGFSVRYVILDPFKIYNIHGPDSGCLIGWDNRRSTKRKRKIRAEIVTMKRNRHDKFFANLEHSILSKGFANPIMVNSGHPGTNKVNLLPEHMQIDPNKILICVHGGSRLYYAQKYKMKIPCVICDWGPSFRNEREIRSEAEFLSLYTTPPKFRLTPLGIQIRDLTHIHMP